MNYFNIENRGLISGIFGLAIIGAASVAPLAANATAVSEIDISRMQLTGSLTDGSASFSSLATQGAQSSATTSGGASYDLTTSAPDATASFDLNLSGSATGTESNPAAYDVSYAATLPGSEFFSSVLSISNVTADDQNTARLTLDFLVEGMLSASVDSVADEGASASIFSRVQVRTDSGNGFGIWTPSFSSACTFNCFGDTVNAGTQPLGTYSATNSVDVGTSGSLFFDLVDGWDYQFRMATTAQITGYSELPETPEVPLPPALPLLGFALGGLGLAARLKAG